MIFDKFDDKCGAIGIEVNFIEDMKLFYSEDDNHLYSEGIKINNKWFDFDRNTTKCYLCVIKDDNVVRQVVNKLRKFESLKGTWPFKVIFVIEHLDASFLAKLKIRGEFFSL